MKTTDFSREITSALLQESLDKRFNQRLNLEKYTMEQLEDFRNKIRTNLSQFEVHSKFNESMKNETYQRNKLILDILNAHISESETRNVTEGVDQRQAAVIQAAVDMVNKIKNMMEDIGSMTTKSMVALNDDIREIMGNELAEQYTEMTTPALQTAMGALKQTRDALEQSVKLLSGDEMPDATIGADPMAMGMGGQEPVPAVAGPDTMNAEEDDFAASDAAAGGPEIAGRMKRESREIRKPSLSESMRLMSKLAR